ncbi:pentatricopeptide repeat-containing protein At2g03380, mitochondrial [Amaranthus tricolor]|uniref:pentatricopeptide repeat-containing protein At2g03380, mitochondrial n=1 Tax=Amaranthus tricolor TaxID=29722 RepID=UPI00258883AA|nr:pentatricopeptide repeat-containing protein At2g03380, mitochondrial [Amaranthus tricolor]
MNHLSFHLFKPISWFFTKSSIQWRALSTFPNPYSISSSMTRTIALKTRASLNPAYLLMYACKNLPSLRVLHALLTVHGLTDDLLCLTKLVSLYGAFGSLSFAHKVFDKIPNPDFYSFKVLIRWYFKNGLHSETILCYNCLRKHLKETDDVLFSIVLKACCQLRDVDQGKKIHCHIVKSGPPDSFVLTTLLDLYAKCREIDSARNIFEEIEIRDIVSWTSLMIGYVQNDCPQEALMLFNRMRENLVDGNHFTLGSLLTGCGKLRALHQGKWFHGYIIKVGINLNSILATTLIDMYVKCRRIKDARSIFDEMSTSNDCVAWTAMIVGYTQCYQETDALELFKDKIRDRFLPNSMTIANVVSACSKLKYLNMGRSVHCLSIVQDLEDVDVKHALIYMYAKCMMFKDAKYIFESLPIKNVITWNSIISGYVQSGNALEALKLFHRMILESGSPDAMTFVSVISACASISTIKLGSSLHAYMIRDGFSHNNIYVATALLNFYAKCGDAISARKVFNEMRSKNEVTWVSMIRSYGMIGDGEESIALFENMLKENWDPNGVIFTTVLSACSHSGNIKEGWKHFSSMCEEHKLVPTMKHYVCMVDLLARAGKLDEAAEFMEDMPIQPDMSVLGALVHGCILHSRLDLGEKAARKMLDMHPNEACYYVMLCKLYALEGRWEKENEIRNLMKGRGLSKSPGWSFSETDTCKHLPFS